MNELEVQFLYLIMRSELLRQLKKVTNQDFFRLTIINVK
jgi:hypothetical protein